MKASAKKLNATLQEWLRSTLNPLHRPFNDDDLLHLRRVVAREFEQTVWSRAAGTFSADGNTVLTASEDGVSMIRCAGSGERLRTLGSPEATNAKRTGAAG